MPSPVPAYFNLNALSTNDVLYAGNLTFQVSPPQPAYYFGAVSVGSSTSVPKAVYGAGYMPAHMLGAGTGEQFRPRLRPGPGRVPTQGGCLVEVTSFLHDGASWTDKAPHIDPSVRSLAIYLNDMSEDQQRQELLALAPHLNQARDGLDFQTRAAVWLRTGAHALKARAGGGAAGTLLEELPQAMAAFTHYPTGAWIAQVRHEAASTASQPWSQLLRTLADAMEHYLAGNFAVAFDVIAPLVGGSTGALGMRGVEVLRMLLEGYTQAAGVTARTLADVPAQQWERMHRVMFGLAA